MRRALSQRTDRGGKPARLDGLRIAIPSHGSLDRVADVLEHSGALCWRCPLPSAASAFDEQGARRWLQQLVDGQLDDVIFQSAEGAQQLLAIAGRLDMSGAVMKALSGVRRVARGRRTAYFLEMISLAPQVCSPEASNRSLIEQLRDVPLAGRAIGVQLAGQDPARELLSFLTVQQGRPSPVATDGSSTGCDEELLEFIDEAARGELDAFLFTSAFQVSSLGSLAAHRDREAVLRGTLNAMTVAGVGVGTVTELLALGVRGVIALDRRFLLRRLTDALAAGRQRANLGTDPLPIVPRVA